MMRSRRSRTVCIDFNWDRLSMLEVADGAVTAWEAAALPDGLIRNGDPVDPGQVAAFLAQSLAGGGMQGRRARIALPDQAAVSRHITLPPMSNRDLARAVRFEAERHLPIRIDSACWSWDVVERSREGIRVYMVAAWRDVVQHYSEVARGADLEPEVLEPRSVALARALDQDRVLLVDGTPKRLSLTLLVGGQPVFTDDQDASPDRYQRQEALDRLLQRAFRYQTTAASGGSPRMAPVLLAGDLERAELPLTVPGGPVTQVLNGHLPSAPSRFPAGGYLANLGLAMRSRR
jgi:Tfp pilus assembly PilM family ATPase